MGKLRSIFSYITSIFKLERSILIYVFAWSMIGLAHVGLIGVLGNLYVLRLGFDFHFLGILNGSSQIIWALFAFPAGMIGQRYGLRNSVVAAYVVVTVGLAAYLSAAWFPAPFWAPILLVGNSLVGIAAALVVVNGIPYLMAISSNEERNKAFTLQTAVFAVTAFLGSLLGGLLPGLIMNWFPGVIDETSAFNATMWLAVPIYIVAAMYMRTARKEPSVAAANEEGGGKATAPVATLLFLGILFGLQMAGENAVNFFMNVYFAENLLQSAAVIGSTFAVARLLPFFVSPLQPLVLSRLGSGHTLVVFSLLVAAGSFFLSVIPTVTVAVTVFVLFNIFSSFTVTARNLFGQEVVQPRWRTTSSAVLSISTAVAGGLIGFTAGPIIQASGFRGLFLVSAVLSILTVFVYAARYVRKYRRLIDVQPEVLSNK
jgi:MFS family permease